MPEATIDPLYIRIGELLADCGATIGETGSMMRALAPDPATTLRRFQERLAGAGLRPQQVHARDRDEVRLAVLDSIDRVVSITIAVDLLAQGHGK